MTARTIERKCGDCQLCCKLLPVRSPLLNKDSNTKCKYQKFNVGCTVYNSQRMPFECGAWNCRWLVNDDTADISRPDRSHYVIDLMPDFIVIQPHDTMVKQNLEVIQVWVDSRYPDAWRDPDLLSYLERRGLDGKAALIRYDANDSFVLLPPAMCSDGEFHDTRNEKGITTESLERTHTATEIADVLGDFQITASITQLEDTNGKKAK